VILVVICASFSVAYQLGSAVQAEPLTFKLNKKVPTAVEIFVATIAWRC
jgi:hypothetical protein